MMLTALHVFAFMGNAPDREGPVVPLPYVYPADDSRSCACVLAVLHHAPIWEKREWHHSHGTDVTKSYDQLAQRSRVVGNFRVLI